MEDIQRVKFLKTESITVVTFGNGGTEERRKRVGRGF